MSLFIIGSVSRVTSNIIHQISRNSQFKSVTVADLLPLYDYHHRFYRLQKQLEQSQSQLQLNLTRLSNINDIRAHSQFDQVLYVTHDYYQNVAAKTRLMELTAQACKNRKYLYFATPVQYDHFGYANPEAKYKQSENKVFKLNPNSTIIRSESIQDSAQASSYLRTSHLNFKYNFIHGYIFAKTVCDTIAAKVQGKKILVKKSTEVESTSNTATTSSNSSSRVDESEYKHAKENLSQLVTKIGQYTFKGYNGEPEQVPAPKVEIKNKKQEKEASAH